MNHFIKKIIGVSGMGFCLTLPLYAHAAGYKLEFQSPSVLADGGGAAVVEDASTNWYNSAGLVDLPQQLSLSAIDVYSRTQFRGSATAPELGTTSYTASGTAHSRPNSILPAIHYSLPIQDRWALGLSIVPAWGLKENYGSNSMVRYSLTNISTKTIDIAPSAAMKLNNHWSIGLGPDFNYFYVQSQSHAYTPLVTSTNDSIARYSADSWNTGWHAGVLYHLDDATRVGLNYRSKIVMHLHGESDFVLSGIAHYSANNFRVNIPLPPTASLSVYHDLSPKWALMGTVNYDQWSVIKDYYGYNYSTPLGNVNVAVPQRFHNTFDWSIGTHYTLNEQWLLRGSFKFEPTPTVDNYRALSFPDTDKFGINVGARYQINKRMALDLIYAHVFTKTMAINDTNPSSGANSSGHASTSIDLAGAQLVWDI